MTCEKWWEKKSSIMNRMCTYSWQDMKGIAEAAWIEGEGISQCSQCDMWDKITGICLYGKAEEDKNDGLDNC